MKLLDILFENVTKKNYIDSIKKLSPKYKISVVSKDDSDILNIKIRSEDGNEKDEFSRFVNNNRIRQIENPSDESIRSLIKKHDEQFSKKNKIELKESLN